MQAKQVDNRDSVYDLKLLKAMYRYLNARGSLFYIKYRGRLCGDVCLHPDGEINIVVAKSFQNKHIGRRVTGEIQKLAREQHIPKLHAEIYSFNTQSQRMFERAGFHKAGDELYEMELQLSNRKSTRSVSGRFFHSSELGAVIVVVVVAVDETVIARELFDHAVRRGE